MTMAYGVVHWLRSGLRLCVLLYIIPQRYYIARCRALHDSTITYGYVGSVVLQAKNARSHVLFTLSLFLLRRKPFPFLAMLHPLSLRCMLACPAKLRACQEAQRSTQCLS